VCFHGNIDCHGPQIDWLFPIYQELQTQVPNIRLELFGDDAVYKRFRTTPRVTIQHPMSWPNYLDFSSMVKRDIALVPLLPSLFNAARGPSKFFDNARLGAVGIYSDVEPYKNFVRHGVDGFLLPNTPSIWIDTILQLSRDSALRIQMVSAARERIQMEYGGSLNV
jgi:glycosyltransferase involved in cell wall biosynthesis